MSENYDKVAGYYKSGLWNLDRVKKAVGRWITSDEFTKITGKPFS